MHSHSATAWTGLRLPADVIRSLRFEPLRVLQRIDSAKRHQLVLDPAFPLSVNLYAFPAAPGAIQASWHERLEIFCPLAGPGTFHVGSHTESFEAGDILLIDNLRLHGVDTFEGPCRQALVVVFTSDLLAAPGALPCDLWLLQPFHNLAKGCLRLSWSSDRSRAAWDCLTKLLAEELEGAAGPARQARQKLALTELLIVLHQAFQDRIVESSGYESRRERLRRLAPLFDFLAANLDVPLGVPGAARLVSMSPSYFMRFFRTATGLRYSAYVDHLRVSRAYQLLVESDLSLAQIAAETGYCDQCHLSRHVRRRFGTSPGRIRSGQREVATPAAATGS
ncbi:MAG: helix-turn-helix domain-containing protein [Bryobacterales bacterium]|nr:helix-turn-helix domain-containing protein [Bryobacterales bacterium]